MNTTDPSYGQEGYDSYRNDFAILGVILFVVCMWSMPKTLRRWGLGLWISAVSLGAAVMGYGLPRPEQEYLTSADGLISTASSSGQGLRFAWYGWIALAAVAYFASMWRSVSEHLANHTYQKRPGLFSKVYEDARFSWIPPGGTVVEQPVYYPASAPASPPAPPRMPLVVSDEQLRKEAAARGRDAQRAAQRRSFVASPVLVSAGPRRENHGTFVINDHRGFDPEVD